MFEVKKSNNDDGERYRYSVSLMIKHPTKSLDVFSSKLGLVPQHIWTKGDACMTPAGTPLPGVRESSYWVHCIECEEHRFFSREIDGLVGILEQHAELLFETIETGGRVTIIVNLPGDVNIGDEVQWTLLQRLSQLRVSIGLEVFPEFH